jgi:hypothetical protein
LNDGDDIEEKILPMLKCMDIFIENMSDVDWEYGKLFPTRILWADKNGEEK